MNRTMGRKINNHFWLEGLYSLVKKNDRTVNHMKKLKKIKFPASLP